MYAPERQQELASMVAHQRRVAVSQAADHFGVTTETVRRDLALLERRGLVRRVHGGAVPASALTTLELAFAEREVAASAEKDRIALAARELIPRAGGSVILDAGTTTGRLARLFSSDAALTVVTNSVPTAATLAGNPALELTVLGGRVRSRTSAAVGDEAAVKSAMVAAGRLVVVLADSSKIAHESLVRFARLDQVDALVTDSGVDDEAVRALEAADIEVVIA
jgi:DeoR family fructose operon transcriptional repressor